MSIDLEKAITSDGAAEYGFSWTTGEVGRGAGNDHKVITTNAQFVKVENLALFTESVGADTVLEFITGTSLKVRSDAVNRSVHEKTPKASIDDRRREVVRRVLLGVRATGGGGTRTVTVYEGMDGKTYASKTEVQAANMAHLIDKGVPAELARSIVLQDAGQTEQA